MANVKEVSMTSIPRGMQTSATAAARRRAIADELMKQSLSAKDRWTIDTGKYLVPDIGAGIGKIGQALLGRKYGEEADADMQALLNQAERQRQQETAAYLAIKRGGQDLGNAPVEGQMGPPRPEDMVSKPNVARAIAMGLLSSDPTVQAMAAKDEAGLPTLKDVLKDGEKWTPATSQGMMQGEFGPGASTIPKLNVVEGTIVASDPNNGNTVNVQAPVQYSDVTMSPETGLPQYTNLATNKPGSLTGGSVTQPGDVSAKALAGKSADALVDEVKASKARLLDLKKLMPDLAQMPDLIRRAETGAAADIKAFVRNWANAFNIPVDVDKIDSYQTMKRVFFPQMIEKLKMQGTGQSMSDKDAIRAIEGAMASPTFNADALIRANGAIVAGIMNATGQHGRLLESYGKMRGADEYMQSGAFHVQMDFPPELIQKYGLQQDPQSELMFMPLTGTVPGGSVTIAPGVKTPIGSQNVDELLKKYQR
jgi:hypothetical protein